MPNLVKFCKFIYQCIIISLVSMSGCLEWVFFKSTAIHRYPGKMIVVGSKQSRRLFRSNKGERLRIKRAIHPKSHWDSLHNSWVVGLRVWIGQSVYTTHFLHASSTNNILPYSRSFCTGEGVMASSKVVSKVRYIWRIHRVTRRKPSATNFRLSITDRNFTLLCREN